MPSSKDRRRVEVPTNLYDRLKDFADSEERTLTSVLEEVIRLGLANYRADWMPRFFMERFNESARRTLALAREEAQQLHNDYIGTEHVLLGLLRENDGIAAQVLRQLWIELDKTRAAVVYILSKGKPAAMPASPVLASASEEGNEEGDAESDIGYTLRVRKVFALAVEEAQRLEHDYVGTEHLLLALAREGEGLAAGILQTFGALGKVREFTLARLDAKTALAQQETTTLASEPDTPSFEGQHDH